MLLELARAVKKLKRSSCTPTFDTGTLHTFRMDRKNAGDWWCAPTRYFPFKSRTTIDALDAGRIPNRPGVVIVGGGGMGREYFRAALDILKRPDRQYKLIAWGVGSDVREHRAGIVAEEEGDLLGDFFDGFDEIGTRIWNPGGRAEWVPCSSCMHEALGRYRLQPAKFRLGVYQHRRVPIDLGPRYRVPSLDNKGNDIEAKLAFMARFEYVVTNSYHGVYWATLLNRKVICMPFKSGLYSFRHRPAYIRDDLTDEHFDTAQRFPDALDECRIANIEFYAKITRKYGDL